MGHGLKAIALLAGISVAAATQAAQSPAKPQPEPFVKLSIESPQNKKDLPTPITYSSGWSLMFKLEASTSALGIAPTAAPATYTGLGDLGYIVFTDPDGCLALPPPFVRDLTSPCDLAESDETYLEWTNDVDSQGQIDWSTNPDQAADLADPTKSGEPAFLELSKTGQTQATPVGPLTGDAVADAYGYGADDDLPGLVLLAGTGPALVLGANFDPVTPRQQRNLAGFMNWVASTLREPTGKITVYAGMVVPYGLVAPLMAADDCVGSDCHCSSADSTCAPQYQYRIDGGAVQTSSNGGSYSSYPALFDSRTYTLRAFLVNGTAPSVITDSDGDGDVDARDVVLGGYTVISNMATVTLRQFHDTPCSQGLANVIYVDLDGNGEAYGAYVCPAGPGQIKTPPN